MKINKKIRMILLSTALVFGSMFLTACQDGKNTANSKDQTQTSQMEKPLMKILRQTMKRIVRTSHPKTRARTKRTQARPNKPR